LKNLDCPKNKDQTGITEKKDIKTYILKALIASAISSAMAL